MDISEVKSALFDAKIQVIKSTLEGRVIESDNTLFPLKESVNIGHLNPFFEGLVPLFSSLSQNTSFPCVNLTNGANEIIIDLELVPKDEFIFLVLYDFTEHYKYSHPLVQEKNETAIARYKLAFEKDLLEAKEAFKNQFIAHFNHELRNPLNSLLGFLDILSSSKVTYEQKEILNLMQRTGSNLKVLINDLLDISKVEEGIIDIKEVPFGFTALLNSLSKQFELRYETDTLKMLSEIHPDIPARICGDPVRINQVLVNLLENAFKNTQSGTVTLMVEPTSMNEEIAMLAFHVIDTGVGISEVDLPKIFDPYFQINNQKIKPSGDGLGLKIVKELTDLMGGSISVSSKPNVGTHFTVNLPLKMLKKKASSRKKTVPKGSGIIRGVRVLVVEDEAPNQMLLMKNFIEKGQFHLEIAKDGQQAIDLVESRKYNVVLLNMQLPIKDGFEVIKHIRDHKESKINSLPIIVTSGKTLKTEQAAILEAGANAFIGKPYTKRELFDSINNLV